MADVSITKLAVRPLTGSIVFNEKAGAAISIGDLVYKADADDLVYQTDASVAGTTNGAVGIVVGSGANLNSSTGDVAANEPCAVCWFGCVAVQENAFTVGDVFYVSDTAGAMGDAAGTVSRVFGNAVAHNILFVNPAVQ